MKPVDLLQDPSQFLEKVRPNYPRLFRAAHALAGNAEIGEYILRNALVETYLRRSEWIGRMRLRDSLMHTLCAVASAEMPRIHNTGTYENDWTFSICEPSDSGALGEISRMDPPMQRFAVLYYGCDLTPRQAAGVMGIRVREAEAMRRRLRALLVKRSPKANAAEDRAEAAIKEAMGRQTEDTGEMGSVFRAFERDVDGCAQSDSPARRVFGGALKAVFAVLLVALFWLLAVLLDPGARVSPKADDAKTALRPPGISEKA